MKHCSASISLAILLCACSTTEQIPWRQNEKIILETDFESQAVKIREDYLGTFGRTYEIISPFRPDTKSLDSRTEVLNLQQIAALSEATDLPENERDDLKSLIREIITEGELGLFDLNSRQLTQLYDFPAETRAAISSSLEDSSHKPAFPRLNSAETLQLLDYVSRRMRLSSDGATNVLAWQPLMHRVHVRFPNRTRKEAMRCAEIRKRWTDDLLAGEDVLESRRLAEYQACRQPEPFDVEDSSFRRELGNLAEGKVEAQLQSVFFSAIDPSPTQIERLNRVHELLVSRLPAKYRNLAMRTTISVGDPSLLEGGRSAHRIMMATNDAGHIIVSPMVLRAGYSYCSSLAAQISSMSETLLATSGDERVASTRVADTLRRNHELVVRAERIARVRAWSTSFEPTMTKEYVKKNLRDAIAAYDECVVMVFAMPMAHELAHVYLGRQSDDRIQLYLDERGCDCAAAAHVETIRVGRVGWRANDYYKLFAKTFADAVVFFPEKILPEGSQTSKLLLARFTALGTIDQCSKYEDLMNAFGLVLWPGRQVP